MVKNSKKVINSNSKNSKKNNKKLSKDFDKSEILSLNTYIDSNNISQRLIEYILSKAERKRNETFTLLLSPEVKILRLLQNLIYKPINISNWKVVYLNNFDIKDFKPWEKLWSMTSINPKQVFYPNLDINTYNKQINLKSLKPNVGLLTLNNLDLPNGSSLIDKPICFKKYSLLDKKKIGLECSKNIFNIANKSIKERGQFILGLSGGSIITTLSEHLIKLSKGNQNMNLWKIFFADERFVDIKNPDSNAGAWINILLQMNISEENILTINNSLDLSDCALDYQQRLLKLSHTKKPEIDVVILGMGEDGHTASLFPDHHHNLDENNKWVFSINNSPKLPPKRVTLSYECLNLAQNCFFISCGQSKRLPLSSIFYDKKCQLPASLINCSNTLWYIDDEAFPNQSFTLTTKVTQQISNTAFIVSEDSELKQLTTTIDQSLTSKISLHNRIMCTTSLFKSIGKSLPLSIIVFGANGDLAKKKIFPSIYHLINEGAFPEKTNIVGFDIVSQQIFEQNKVNQLKNVKIDISQFNQPILIGNNNFDQVIRTLEKYEQGKNLCGRIFFLSVPPQVMAPICQLIKEKGLNNSGIQRIVCEKPFGTNYYNSLQLTDSINQLFPHHSTIKRIDHYLGKSVLLNIKNFRWNNNFIEPTLNNQYIENIDILFSEDLDVADRISFFDQTGIIRDIIQNHLTQILTLITMDRPDTDTQEAFNQQVYELLKSVKVDYNQYFVGQYQAYQQEYQQFYSKSNQTSPKVSSNTPTFCSVIVYINNHRWENVPIRITAGKGLEHRVCNLRLKYRKNLSWPNSNHNELVLRIQPDEAFYLTGNSEILSTGCQMINNPSVMDLKFSDYTSRIPDAYEKVLVDVLNGDGPTIITTQMIELAWKIWTPFIFQIDQHSQPVLYPKGAFPPEFDQWSAQQGFYHKPNWEEFLATYGDGKHHQQLECVFHQLDQNKDQQITQDEFIQLIHKLFPENEANMSKAISELDIQFPLNLGQLKKLAFKLHGKIKPHPQDLDDEGIQKWIASCPC